MSASGAKRSRPGPSDPAPYIQPTPSADLEHIRTRLRRRPVLGGVTCPEWLFVR